MFSPIDKGTNKDELQEKILIYIRLVEVFADYHKISLQTTSISTDAYTRELKDIGLLDCNLDNPTKEDIDCCNFQLNNLSKILGSKLYLRFQDAVNFAIVNKGKMGNILDKVYNSKRKELQKAEALADKPTFVDFFAGAGGLSCGFIQAGYKVCFANDFEDVCVRTYRYNHPELPEDRVLKGDIRNIVDNIQDYVKESVDLVVGGPPCQGFSSANQQRIIDDPRNELYKYYIKAVRSILPKFVVMENVKGMLKVANQVVEDYQSIEETINGKKVSYKVSYEILNSVNFGVAQSRERLIYIAIRTDVIEEKGITPQTIFNDIHQSNNGNHQYLLRDALEYIKTLEAPREKNTNEVDSEISGKKIDVNTYNGNENEYLKMINGGRKIPFLFNHKARYVNDVNYDIYRLLNQGDDASDSKISAIMPYKNRLHCFKDKYYKLIADRPSRTITAHLRMDCHSHIHPYQIRALTPREAARCQSFPDDYLFLGAYLKTYMQIGNAVPCLMAKGIAEVIKKYL